MNGKNEQRHEFVRLITVDVIARYRSVHLILGQHNDAAETLDVPVNTFRPRLSWARVHLGEEMAEFVDGAAHQR